MQGLFLPGGLYVVAAAVLRQDNLPEQRPSLDPGVWHLPLEQSKQTPLPADVCHHMAKKHPWYDDGMQRAHHWNRDGWAARSQTWISVMTSQFASSRHLGC